MIKSLVSSLEMKYYHKGTQAVADGVLIASGVPRVRNEMGKKIKYISDG